MSSAVQTTSSPVESGLAEHLPAETVERALEEVFARPEFARAEPTWTERFFDWIASLFEQLSLPEGISEGVGWAILWTLGVLIGALLVYSLWRLNLALRRDAVQAEAETARSVRERVDELRQQAERARLAGDRVLALRLYFFALVVGLGKRGDLEYRDAWTNRELLARGHPSPEVAGELGPLVNELDHKLFGDGETTERDLDRMSDLLGRWLDGQGAEASAAASSKEVGP